MDDSESDAQDNAHFTFDWRIENMCVCNWLSSPTFTAQTIDKTWWYLRLHVSNTSESIRLGIYRFCSNNGPDEIEVKFELSFLGIDGLPLIKKLSSMQFRKDAEFTFKKFSDRDEVFVRRREEFFPGGALTVRCRMWETGKEKTSKHESCFARTVLREFRGSCISEIRDFSTLRVGQERKAIVYQTDETAFPYTINCFLREEDGEQYVCIVLRKSDNRELNYGKVKICLLDEKRINLHSMETGFYTSNAVNFEDFLERRKLTKERASLLPNDVLSLRLEYDLILKVSSEIENSNYLSSPECEKQTSEIPKEDPVKLDETSNNKSLNSPAFEDTKSEIDNKAPVKLDNTSAVPSYATEALRILFQDGVCNDVVLRAGSKCFPAHKCILSVRSPVFKAMFTGDMQEKTSKCVEISDVDENTLKELLSYIYMDKVGELDWRTAESLYRAADKYELLDLKNKCSNFLQSDLSASSVCAVLVVADLHHDQELQEAAHDFIKWHKEEVFASDTWRRFTEENTKLAMETMQRLLYIKYFES